MLHGGDGVFRVMCSVSFQPYIEFSIKAKNFSSDYAVSPARVGGRCSGQMRPNLKALMQNAMYGGKLTLHITSQIQGRKLVCLQKT